MRAIALVCLALILAGCGSSGPRLVSVQARLPKLDVPPKLVYTPEETKALTAFATQEPLLARKIVNNGNALRKAVEAYERHRWENNAAMLRRLGYTEPEIRAIEGPNPAQAPAAAVEAAPAPAADAPPD
ncbi:MAG: hypothetical protein HS116_18470 [Planctomycetes bacterium]|nr:hypothetical protein [Planctomycetota bacterium]